MLPPYIPFALFLCGATVWASPTLLPPRENTIDARDTSPVVDLGYGVYEGYYNATANLNIFKGIRYAAAPIGNLRWQPPQPPVVDRNATILATSYPPACPQSQDSPDKSPYSFPAGGTGHEDCLFLNVFTPTNSTNLPVLVYIHGGGYGGGSGSDNFEELIITNNNTFIMVNIQYRLGAFGFLSSAELAKYGHPNAGLLDQHYALEWTQKYIERFGGDPKCVTIAGESAGGGSVLQQALAYGGSEGTRYFTKAIVASPYLPMQWGYDDSLPTYYYNKFAQLVGCLDTVNGTTFSCLVAADTLALQNASAYISVELSNYGEWSFLPVVDGTFIQVRPTVQLAAGKVNGLRILSGNNADEGVGFTPQNITTEADFQAYIATLFPLMNAKLLAALSDVYAIEPLAADAPLFSTLGTHGPTALNQSEFGVGQQQRANNLYAETTFVCPAYWLANGYSSSLNPNRKSWKYQFSVPPSEHGADLDAYQLFNREALGLNTMTPAFRKAVQDIWGNFIRTGDPTLSSALVSSLTIGSSGKSTGDDLTAAKTGNWREWLVGCEANWRGSATYKMLNLNMTGGVPVEVLWNNGFVHFNVTQYANPGLAANLAIVDGYSWEGGRGARCEFFKEIGKYVPE